VSEVLFDQDFDADFFLRGQGNALVDAGLEDSDRASDQVPEFCAITASMSPFLSAASVNGVRS
jgi:hypothetical protein